MMFFRLSGLLAVALVIGSTIGCAPIRNSPPEAAQPATFPDSTADGVKPGDDSLPDGSKTTSLVPIEVWNAVKGAYGSVLFKQDVSGQVIQQGSGLSIGETKLGDKTYGQVEFKPETGNLNVGFNAYLAYLGTLEYGQLVYYSFITNVMQVQSLTSLHFAVEMTFAFQKAVDGKLSLVVAQSFMNLWNCEASENNKFTCRTYLDNAWLDNLQKR